LALIADASRHGDALTRALEAPSTGAYSARLGVSHPTLSWLEALGFATVQAAGHRRKRHPIALEGGGFLQVKASASEPKLNPACAHQ